MDIPTTAPCRRRRLRLATGLEYALRTWGDGPHLVLLLHGFLDAGVGWQPAVEAGLTAPGLRLVAPDWRGHGDSDRIGAGGYYHFADYLADLHDLIGQLAAETTTSAISLVGHSMGGSIAAYYAGTFPKQIHRLVLMEGLGPPMGLPSGPERVSRWLEQWARVREKPAKTYASLEDAAARIQAADPRLAPQWARLIAQETTRPAPSPGSGLIFKHDPLHVTEGPVAFDVAVAERFWRGIACETLLIDGAETEFRHAPAELARREGCIARARKLEIAGAGHMIQRHQPAALAAAVRDFLTET